MPYGPRNPRCVTLTTAVIRRGRGYVQQDLTRREALKRGAGFVGAVAWAAPVVQLVGMSPAFAAQTSPVATDCCIGPDGKNAKLASVTMTYLGGGNDCTTSSFTQSPTLVSCTDTPDPGNPASPLPDPAYIVASHQESIFNNDGTFPKPAARIWFSGVVPAGGSFTALASNASETALKGETWIHVFSGDAAVQANYRQKVAFHTSCSEPLFTGDKFASLLLTGCTSEPPKAAGSTSQKKADETTQDVEAEDATTTTTVAETVTTSGGEDGTAGTGATPPETGDGAGSSTGDSTDG